MLFPSAEGVTNVGVVMRAKGGFSGIALFVAVSNEEFRVGGVALGSSIFPKLHFLFLEE